MASESVATYKPATVDAVRELCGDHPVDVLAVMEIAATTFQQLSALFRVISDKSNDGHSAGMLAELGKYVADDIGNFVDCRREDYADTLTKA